MTEQQQQQQQWEAGVEGDWYDLCGWWSCQQEKLLWSACWTGWQPDIAALEPLPSALLRTSPPVSVAAVHGVPAAAVHAVPAASGPPLAGLSEHAELAASGLPAAGEVQDHGGFHYLAHLYGQ